MLKGGKEKSPGDLSSINKRSDKHRRIAGVDIIWYRQTALEDPTRASKTID